MPMNAEIICIGTELLLGHIVNTNASFIAARLAEAGIDHYFQVTVGDNPKRLSDTIRNALKRSNVIITTGGLGPTVDDITAHTIAGALNMRLVLDRSAISGMNEFFKRLNHKIPKTSLRQALVPEGARCLNNPLGTAPGIVIESGEKIIIALPGPPREMQPMMENHVIPYLKKKFCGKIIKSRSIKLIGIAEAAVNDKVKDLLELSGPVQVGIYAKQREVELKIMAKAENEKLTDLEIAKIEKQIRKRLGEYVYGADKETLEQIVGDRLIKKNKTIATAESCTGGLAANLLTNVSGSSSYFKEGLITYSNESKVKYLGVPPKLIKDHGAVSPEVAKRMAKGIREKAGTDIGLGITGIAGPTGATKSKPVGLVYIALATKNKLICKQFNFLGSRIEIKYQAAMAALDLLRKNI